MAKDLTATKSAGSGGDDSSGSRWKQLQALFHSGNQHKCVPWFPSVLDPWAATWSAPILPPTRWWSRAGVLRNTGMSGALQSKIAAIDKENIPAADKTARIKALKQGGEVRRAASRDESRYEDETSMIYGAYKRNMLETKEDQREEVRLPPRPTRSRSGEQLCSLAGEGCAARRCSAAAHLPVRGIAALGGWGNPPRLAVVLKVPWAAVGGRSAEYGQADGGCPAAQAGAGEVD